MDENLQGFFIGRSSNSFYAIMISSIDNYYKEKGDKYGTDQMSTLWRGFYD